MSNVTVVATIRAKPGQEETVQRVLTGLIEPTRAEDGCINYDLHQDLDDGTRFVFHENWTSRDHLDRHLETPHLKSGQEQLGPIVESVEINVLTKIA
jgi:quinol monooxygenase YgiN